ncbi:uncharacterized protein EI90DRAFT_3052239 [Cantharellus anzutake]|uniref:uncharacterized protein n=1 Tax=Cantharellus anzutake TaxID=1750568 RepID=UPI0019068B80|nr:uncharacterized protein EI90DRAFT_3052239 [Cantharellus anzutake]KAF8333511.1 hypothetical protein EI90DRAFT_3052239 [Cantharellus anzutake]
MAPPTCIIAPDPEVSGIGIRISLHITILLVSFIPNSFGWIPSFELRSALLASATLNAFSLLLIGIIKTASKELSLYHAIFIIHNICVLAVATNFVSGRSTQSHFARVGLYWISTWIALAAFLGWSIYVLTETPNFGSQPECNGSIVYVVWFRNVSPTHWVRWVVISFMSLYAVGMVGIPLGSTIFRCLRRAKGGASEQVGLPHSAQHLILPVSAAPTTGASAWRTTFGIRSIDTDTSSEADNVSVFGAFPKRPIDIYGTPNESSFRMFVQPFAAIYGTVMLEFFIRRNNVGPGEDRWTSGQIVIILPVAMGVINELIRIVLGGFGLGSQQ